MEVGPAASTRRARCLPHLHRVPAEPANEEGKEHHESELIVSHRLRPPCPVGPIPTGHFHHTSERVYIQGCILECGAFGVWGLGRTWWHSVVRLPGQPSARSVGWHDVLPPLVTHQVANLVSITTPPGLAGRLALAASDAPGVPGASGKRAPVVSVRAPRIAIGAGGGERVVVLHAIVADDPTVRGSPTIPEGARHWALRHRPGKSGTDTYPNASGSSRTAPPWRA